MNQDEKIIKDVLEGDTQRFAELVLKYQKPLYIAVYSITKNESAAEEICQDAFVLAFEKLSTLKVHAGFYAWLKRIAVNLAFNSYARDKKTVNDDEDCNFFENIPSKSNPEDYIINKEFQNNLFLGIDLLPEKLRLVIVMKDIQELSYDEIAEILGIPVGTVKSRLFSARQMIREYMADKGL